MTRLLLHSRQEINHALIPIFLFDKQEKLSFGDTRPSSDPFPLLGPSYTPEAVSTTTARKSLPDMVIGLTSLRTPCLRAR